jgi:hypothetical protein
MIFFGKYIIFLFFAIRILRWKESQFGKRAKREQIDGFRCEWAQGDLKLLPLLERMMQRDGFVFLAVFGEQEKTSEAFESNLGFCVLDRDEKEETREDG